MAGCYRLAAILIFVFFKLAAACDVDDVAVYNVRLQMLWSEERFPKDYPKNKAQWSQVFGQSHNISYALYRTNEVAKPSVREFAQFGELETLVKEGDEEPKVYDQFTGPAVLEGVGTSQNMLFVDGGHSMISLICRMIPSPDWFVGVDSLNLCMDSSWVDQVTLDLDPLDAGAASGLTFTAPRWETVPPDPVTRHRSRTPNHPGAGFYYPDLRELPTIAKVEITKVQQYSTKEMNELIRKDLIKQLKDKDKRRNLPKDGEEEEEKEQYKPEKEESESKKSYVDQLRDLEEDPVGTPKPNLPENYVEVITKPTTMTNTGNQFEGDLRNMDDVVLAVAHGRKLGLHKHLPRHFRSRLHHAVNKIQPNDCLVSEWSEWSPCSKTCDLGDKFRYRSVLRQKRKGGRDCPILSDRKPCSIIESCARADYIDW